MDGKKALIGMSGGVDSSVAALLMLRAGYECIGATMRLYDNDMIGLEKGHTCCMPMSVLKEDKIFDKVIAMKYDIPNDKPELFEQYKKDIDAFYEDVIERNA